MQHLPVELLDAIFSHCDNDPEVPDTHLRELRLLCKSFHTSLTPLAFRRLRLSQFNRDAFDSIVSFSQSPAARYVTTFEYKIVEHLTPRTAPSSSSSSWGERHGGKGNALLTCYHSRNPPGRCAPRPRRLRLPRQGATGAEPTHTPPDVPRAGRCARDSL